MKFFSNLKGSFNSFRMLFNFQGSSLRLQGLYFTISFRLCQVLFFLNLRGFFSRRPLRDSFITISHPPFQSQYLFYIFFENLTSFFFILSFFLKQENLLTFFRKFDIVIELEKDAPVAQLDRVTGYEPVGQGFESLQARQGKPIGIFRSVFCI